MGLALQSRKLEIESLPEDLARAAACHILVNGSACSEQEDAGGHDQEVPFGQTFYHGDIIHCGEEPRGRRYMGAAVLMAQLEMSRWLLEADSRGDFENAQPATRWIGDEGVQSPEAETTDRPVASMQPSAFSVTNATWQFDGWLNPVRFWSSAPGIEISSAGVPKAFCTATPSVTSSAVAARHALEQPPL
ncbi:hypothetical protein CCMA1212_003778 [Trichoderma ghanense]|uniref:Uncharacterized protein n=1 Tax=Trichoderma ghanense TaxID=65468 RepID=A0ABY2H8A4_9HYPO